MEPTQPQEVNDGREQASDSHEARQIRYNLKMERLYKNADFWWASRSPEERLSLLHSYVTITGKTVQPLVFAGESIPDSELASFIIMLTRSDLPT